MTMYLVSVPSRLGVENQARWWEPLAPVVDGLMLSTIFLRGKVVQLVDLPEAVVPTFHQKAFDELFGQWLPEQPKLNWQPEWTLTWLLVPSGPTQQRLEEALAGHVSTAILRGYWFKDWKHAVALSFSKEQQTELLPIVTAAGWKRLPIPSPLISQSSAGSIARAVAKPASFLPFLSSGATPVASQAPTEGAPGPAGAGVGQVVAPRSLPVGQAGASPLLNADERLSINLGVTPIGESVRVAWMPLRMQVYAEQASLISFLLMMLDRWLLGDEERSTPAVCVLPPSCRDLQAIPALAQRMRFLDPADLYRSATIPLNFLSPERRNAVFARHGVRLGGATVPATTELADFLRDHGAAHLCTAPILAFTAPQPADEQQDELIAVLKQGGGVVLLGEDTWETRLLSDLLWAFIEQELVPEGMPICVMTHAGICPPPSLEQQVFHVQFNPARALQSQAHVEVRSNLDHWILRDFTGERRVLDGDLYASSTDQTHAVVEQLVAAFGETNIPLRRASPYDQQAMVAVLDGAVAGLDEFAEMALPGYPSAPLQPARPAVPTAAAIAVLDDGDAAAEDGDDHLPALDDLAVLDGSQADWRAVEEPAMATAEAGPDVPRQMPPAPARAVQNRAILARPQAQQPAGHLELRYALEAVHHQSSGAADLLRSALEGRQPADWTRYWWEAWLSGAGQEAAARLSEEVAMRQKMHPSAMRLLMESQLMGDPTAVAQYSLMVVGQGEPEAAAPAAEPIIEEMPMVAEEPAVVEAEPEAPPAVEPPKKQRRSLSAFKG